MPGALDLEAQFVDENRYPYSLGHEFLDENRYSYSLGHEFLDEIINLAAPGCSWLLLAVICTRFFSEPVWLDPALSSYFSGTRIFS